MTNQFTGFAEFKLTNNSAEKNHIGGPIFTKTVSFMQKTS